IVAGPQGLAAAGALVAARFCGDATRRRRAIALGLAALALGGAFARGGAAAWASAERLSSIGAGAPVLVGALWPPSLHARLGIGPELSDGLRVGGLVALA